MRRAQGPSVLPTTTNDTMFSEKSSAASAVALAELSDDVALDWVVGVNAAIRRIAEHAQRAAEVQCPVLISGETGTGKELLARRLHRQGPRCGKPFVPVNCAALTPTLAESQ